MALVFNPLWTGALTFFLYYTWTWFAGITFARRHGCEPPPTRYSRNPILGLYYKIQDSRSAKIFKNLPASADLHREYGSTYQEPFLLGTTIKTSSPENIQTVFGSKAKDFGVQPFRLAGMRPFCGDGLLTTDGHIWERSRAMFRPSYHKSNLSDLDSFGRSFDHLIRRIPRDGSTIDLQPLISLMFVDTSTQFLLGRPIGIFNDDVLANSPIDSKSFLSAWQSSLRSCAIRNFLGIFRFMIPKSESVDQWRIVHQLIEFYVDRALQNTGGDNEYLHRSLLDGLIQQTKDKVEIRNHIIQGMMAAQDTTSVLISNTIFLISRHPQVWERLRAEVAFIDASSLTVDNIRKFKQLWNVIHESLRLYPVFPHLARNALQNSVLPTGGGLHRDRPVFAPLGTTILADFYTLHRNKELFGENVEEFRPDRWDSIQPGPWHFMAFGGGQRACLGQQKALLEASYFLIRLAQTFDRVESRDDRDWAGDQKLTAKNAHGCRVALKWA